MSKNRLSARNDQLLNGPIWKGLLSFAIPIFLGNLFQQLYNTADTMIVGRYIGKEALAAVSSSGNLIFMMVGFLNGMSMGASILISRYFGARDHERMRKTIHTDIAFGLVAGVTLTVVGTLVTPQILRWMGTPENVLPSSIAYFRVYFLGSTASFLYNIASSILRAVGDSRHPLYYLIASSVTNVALDLLFVAVFGWGVAAAAAATVISQCLSAVLCMAQLMRTRGEHRVSLRALNLDLPTLKGIVKYGIPSGVQNSVIALANVVVQANINAFGDMAMAGCGSYSKVEGFAFLPVTCFSMSLATFVGQNLGAGQYERVKKGTRFGMVCSMAVAEAFGVFFYAFAPQIIGLFNSDPQVIAYGVQEARVISLFYCLLAMDHCIAGILRGAGKPMVPMVIMLGCWCVLRVVYISTMVPVLKTIVVVFSAYPLTWFISGIIFLVYYLKADWIHHFDRSETAGRC